MAIMRSPHLVERVVREVMCSGGATFLLRQNSDGNSFKRRTLLIQEFYSFHRLKPDWVLRRDRMEEITNPLQAIQMVMDTLGVPY